MSFQRSRISPARPIVSAAILIILLIVAAVRPRDKADDARSERIAQEARNLERSTVSTSK
jgi:hypothetical protein